MRSGNMELKSDLANLFKDLAEAKRENPKVVPISKPKIDQSDIKDLFSGLEEASKEARVVEKKRKDYVEATPADLSNLFKELEEVSRETKNEAPRIPRKKGQPAGSDKHSDLYTDENPKGTIHGLGFKDIKTAKASVKKIENSGKTHAHKIQAAIAMEQRARVMGKTKEAAIYRTFIEKMKKITKEKNKKKEDIDVNPEKLINETINLIEDNVENKPEPETIISKIVENLDDTRYEKEQVDGIEVIRRDFEQFKLNIARQISDKVATSSGGGAGSFSDLDDVDTTTAKVDGKIIQYDGDTNKFVGGDLSSVGVAASNITGTTLASGVTASSLTSVGTLTTLTVDNISINGTTIGHTDDTDLITLANGVVTVAGELSVTTLDIGGTNVTATAAELNILDGVTSTASELNLVDGITAGTVSASKAIIADSNKDLTGLRNLTIAGNLTVSGTTTTVNQTVVNVTDAFVFEGANADAHETTFRVDEPTADRKASLQDKTGTIALLSGFKLNATDGSASNEGDFLVLNTSADDGDRLLFEDGTTDPIAVLASHGITLTGQGWNAFRFDNT